jgi:uncharacterized membrane protein
MRIIFTTSGADHLEPVRAGPQPLIQCIVIIKILRTKPFITSGAEHPESLRAGLQPDHPPARRHIERRRRLQVKIIGSKCYYYHHHYHYLWRGGFGSYRTRSHLRPIIILFIIFVVTVIIVIIMILYPATARRRRSGSTSPPPSTSGRAAASLSGEERKQIGEHKLTIRFYGTYRRGHGPQPCLTTFYFANYSFDHFLDHYSLGHYFDHFIRPPLI